MLNNLATAQTITQNVSARYPGLAVYSKEFSDLYATRSNAAALAQLKESAIGIYAENRFLLPQFNLYSASVGIKTKHGGVAFHGSYFGFDLFHQMQVSFAYGISISPKVDVGVQFNYHSVQQANGYGSASSINGSIGAIFHLTEKVHLGINVYNPVSSELGNKGSLEKLPSQYTFGMGYDASDKVYVSAEMVKEENFPTSVNAGFQYRFQKQLFARLGIATATNNIYGGIGLAFDHYKIDIAASYHPQLGLSPAVLLVFDFGKKVDNKINQQVDK